MSETPTDGRHAATRLAPAGDPDRRGERAALLEGRHANPHQVLGAHAAHGGRRERRGDARAAAGGGRLRCRRARRGDGAPRGGRRLLRGVPPGRALPFRYHLRFIAEDGTTWERGDPYRHLPTIGEMDLYLFREGTHRRLWTMLGAHLREVDGDEGTAFAVWAPNARAGERGRRLVRVGRPPVPDAPARRQRACGSCSCRACGRTRCTSSSCARARARCASRPIRSRSRWRRRRARRRSSCARARIRGATTRG